MSAFWKRRSPFWHIAFLSLVSLLLSVGVQRIPQPPPLQRAAQQWVDDCLGPWRGQVVVLSAETPIKLVVTLDCSEREAETVTRGLHSLTSTDPRTGDRILVVRGPIPLIKHSSLLPALLALLGLGLLCKQLGLLRRRSELRPDAYSLARLATLAGGSLSLGLAWQSPAHRFHWLACALLAFGWQHLQRQQARRKLPPALRDPRQEAAILLMSLPPETSAEVFKELGPEEVHAITLEISKLPPISPEVRHRVIERFLAMSSVDVRRKVESTEAARGLSRFYLKRDSALTPLGEVWQERPLRWRALTASALVLLSLAGFVLSLQRVLPSWRSPLQRELGRYLGTPLQVTQFEREPGSIGLVVALPGAQERAAQTTLPLIQDRLRAMGLEPERTLVVATEPVRWHGVVVGFLGLAALVCLGGLRLGLSTAAATSTRAPLATASPTTAVKPGRTLRTRRRIFSCEACEEVFVDDISLQRHRLSAHAVRPAAVEPSAQPVQLNPAESVKSLLKVDAIGLEVGRGLLGLVDPAQGARLLERVTSIRRHIALELGIVVPGVRFRDNLALNSGQYRICIRDVEVATGELSPNKYLAIAPENKLRALRGERVKDPTYGMPGVWVTPECRGDAERLGCMIFDSVSVVATQLTEVIRTHAADLFTFDACVCLLDDHEDLQHLRRALRERKIDEVVIWKALQLLVREKVCIRDLESILQSFLEGSSVAPWALAEFARVALGRWICKEAADGHGEIQVITLDPALETLIQEHLRGENEDLFLSLCPDQGQEILAAFEAPVHTMQERGLRPVILTSPSVRPMLRKLTERSYPKLTILSWNEIVPGYPVNSLEMVSL